MYVQGWLVWSNWRQAGLVSGWLAGWLGGVAGVGRICRWLEIEINSEFGGDGNGVGNGPEDLGPGLGAGRGAGAWPGVVWPPKKGSGWLAGWLGWLGWLGAAVVLGRRCGGRDLICTGNAQADALVKYTGEALVRVPPASQRCV